ncbi:MAG TPA: hypothetical protein PKM63_16985 [Panacibacter sp.]|nr:hypothetical protein [Panacibacter sp.]HNP45990.1 hypothetical protein [Panacibacter sp.]
MNIREVLLQNKVYSSADILRVASYACSSKENFKELMRCFLANEYRLAQRAAGSVSWAAKKKPAMVAPHIKEIVAQLERNDVHAAVIRNSVRVLEMIDIPESLHGDVMNACFTFIEKPSTPVAIKAFSLTTLFNLSKIYPDIRQELKLIIEERWNDETPAFKSRGKKILQMMQKNG